MQNKPEKNEYLKMYRAKPENKEKHKIRMKLWRRAKFGYLPKKVKYPSLNQKEVHRIRRLECIKHYGGKCACCGESEPKFLALDHIYGGGTKHRKGKGNIVYWIVKNNYPDLFQILCHNCNSAKGFYGECPHTSSQTSVKH